MSSSAGVKADCASVREPDYWLGYHRYNQRWQYKIFYLESFESTTAGVGVISQQRDYKSGSNEHPRHVIL